MKKKESGLNLWWQRVRQWYHRVDWYEVRSAFILSFFVVMLMLVLSFMLCGCAGTKETTSYVERQRIENLMDRMDSVITSSKTVQQDSTWHQTVIKQLQSIKERNDTSHYVVVDSTGKVIKETTIIYREKESVSENDREEREFMMHRLEKMDSVTSANSVLIQRMDSLLQESKEQTIKEVPAKLSWWQQMRIHIANILLWVIGIALAVKFGWPLIKKYIKPL